MKHSLDWFSYQNAGMGESYAHIPVHAKDFAGAVAVCIGQQGFL